MDKDIRQEWEKLKAAIDEYRNNTGFEVAVVSSCISDLDRLAQSFIINSPLVTRKSYKVHGYGEVRHLVDEVVEQQKKTLVTVDVNSEKTHKVENGDSPIKKASNGIRSVPRPRRVQVGFDINAHSMPNPSHMNGVKPQMMGSNKLMNSNNNHTRNGDKTNGRNPKIKVSKPIRKTNTKPKEKQPDSDNDGFVDDLELDEFAGFQDEYYNVNSRSDDDIDLEERPSRQNLNESVQIAASMPIRIGGFNNRRRNLDVEEIHRNGEPVPTPDNMMESIRQLSRSIHQNDSTFVFGDLPQRGTYNNY